MLLKSALSYAAGASFILSVAWVSSGAHAEDLDFSASMQLLVPIQISPLKGLSFPAIVAGSDIDVVVTPESEHAVQFSAQGQPNASVMVSVLESQIELITGTGSSASERIAVDSFNTGGSLDQYGLGIFDVNGELNDVRVGATAHVLANDQPGNYESVATLRITYQ